MRERIAVTAEESVVVLADEPKNVGTLWFRRRGKRWGDDAEDGEEQLHGGLWVAALGRRHGRATSLRLWPLAKSKTEEGAALALLGCAAH